MKTYLLAWNPKRWQWDNIVQMSDDVKIGKGFIHVHHLKQISEIGEAYQVDPIQDLQPVCPNCHAIIHKRKPPYTIEEMKTLLRR